MSATKAKPRRKTNSNICSLCGDVTSGWNAVLRAIERIGAHEPSTALERLDDKYKPAGLKRGRYSHYKGKFYRVVGVATHSETDEKFVVYINLYGERRLWIRPLAMFIEKVEVNGKRVPRFKYVGKS